MACTHNTPMTFMNGRVICRTCYEMDQPVLNGHLYPQPFTQAWIDRFEKAQIELDLLLRLKR